MLIVLIVFVDCPYAHYDRGTGGSTARGVAVEPPGHRGRLSRGSSVLPCQEVLRGVKRCQYLNSCGGTGSMKRGTPETSNKNYWGWFCRW